MTSTVYVLCLVKIFALSLKLEWEIRFREALERLLWVRPRTKEFLVGYPCLVVYYALIKRNWAPHYREVFRVGASFALASAVNSFSYFHTLLPLTIIRVVNGWWLEILVGSAAQNPAT